MQINQYHIFELVRGEDGFPKHGGVHWFNTYSLKNGKKNFIVEDYTDEGKPKKKNVIISEENPLMVHKENTELYNFLIGHPNFEGGANFNGDPIFRLVDLERDAKTRTEEKILRAKAIAHASQLEGSRLYETCSLFGVYFDEESDARALEFIIDQAERDPEDYLELTKRGKQDIKIRYILAGAIRQGIVVKGSNGSLKFGSLTIGINEDNAVARLITEPETLNNIAARVNLIHVDVDGEDAEAGEEEAKPEPKKSVAAKFGAPRSAKA
jgi:hypothetical protein